MGVRRDGAAAKVAAYPAHWEADIALRDGTAAHLRPIAPEDADRLRRFHDAQSERSRYFRFFAPMPHLSPKDVERFTVVDHRDRVALIVLAQDEIVAVGRYDRVEHDEAEIAFNVADSYQGKGLGSVLLEHLAAAAREHGIHTFVADVLPQNSQMINVFTDAGFDVRRTLEDGVVVVEFGIDPTVRSIEVMAEREQRAEARAMETMLHPSSVMIVGASTRADSMGGRILAHLEASTSSTEELYVVTRDAFEIRGHRAYDHISEVPGPLDLAVITLSRPEACLDAVEQCGRIGVRSVLITTEAFSGGGAEGTEVQRRMVARARRYGMRVLGPGTLGFLRTGEDPLNISLSPRLPREGSVALAGQSSALSAMLLAAVDSRGIGVHEFTSVGNRADVSLNDVLQHWQDAPEAEVIALALESMGNPRKFTRIARRLTRTKPVIVLRPPGIATTSPPGHDVRPSELPRRALDHVLEASGVVAARDIDHLMDIVDALARQGVPHGDRVGLLSNSPALGQALRGAAATEGLRVVKENDRVPLGTDERLLERAFTSMAALGEVDVVIASFVDPLSGPLIRTLRQMATVARGSEVALLLCVITEHETTDQLREEVRTDPSLPGVHATPKNAARAAAGLIAAARGAGLEDETIDTREDIDTEKAGRLVEGRLRERPTGGTSSRGPHLLGAEDTGDLLTAYGLRPLSATCAESVVEAERIASLIGYPVALKSSDPLLRHRSDLGGVRLDIADPAQLRRAYDGMRRELAFSSAPLEVQRMAPPGVPVVVRTYEDPSLGPVLSFSIGGDATDLLDDIAYAIPPLGPRSVQRLIDAPASAAKLRGREGLPPADREALADVLSRVGLLADDLPQVHMLELYPVVVGHEGCTIVGARVELAHAPNRTDGARRTLNAPAGH